MFVCLGMHVQACAYCNACVEVIGQPTEMGSLLPPRRCYSKYLGCMSPLQVHLPLTYLLMAINISTGVI